MKQPLYNLVNKIFWSCVPLGIVVWWFERHGNGDDTLNGIDGWTRVYSSYEEPIGAKILIRKQKDK